MEDAMRAHRVLALILAVAATTSACHRAPEAAKHGRHPRHVKIKTVAMQAGSTERMVMASWNRPGAWTRLTAVTPTGDIGVAAARDAYGARFVTTNGTMGYAITRGTVDCGHDAVHLAQSVTAATDKDDPDVAKRGMPPRMFLRGDQIKQLCAASPHSAPRGDLTTPGKAVEGLRRSAADRTQAVQVHAPTFTKLRLSPGSKLGGGSGASTTPAQAK